MYNIRYSKKEYKRKQIYYKCSNKSTKIDKTCLCVRTDDAVTFEQSAVTQSKSKDSKFFIKSAFLEPAEVSKFNLMLGLLSCPKKFQDLEYELYFPSFEVFFISL